MKESRSKIRLSKPYKLLIPSLLTLYTLIGIGVVSAAVDTAKHLDKSMKIFSSSDFYVSLGLSIRLAVLSTVLASSISLLILYGLFTVTVSKENDTKTSNLFFSRLFQTPMLVPYIVAGYLVFLTFGQSGLLSRMLYSIGLIDGLSSFPILVNDPSGIGIIIAFVWKTTPFMILMLYPAMLTLDNKYLNMSRMFGLKPSRYYFEVLLPHMAPTIAFSGFIVFSYTLTSFEIPFMLGGATYLKHLQFQPTNFTLVAL